MTKLAEKAGTAGNDSSPKKSKLGIVASFIGATAMSLTALTAGVSAAPAPTPPVPATPAVKTPAVKAAETAPTIKEAANNNFRTTGPVIDPDSEWTIRLSGEVNQGSMERIIDKMRELNGKDPTKEITLLINSPGGSVSDGMALYDVMQSISNDVRTVCEGEAASMAAVLLAGGTPGKRYAYESCAIMIHELAWSTQGKISVMDATTAAGDRHNELLVGVLSKHSGLTRETLRSIMTIDLWVDGAKEAKELGLVDHVIPHKPMEVARKRNLPASFCDKPERQKLRACPAP